VLMWIWALAEKRMESRYVSQPLVPEHRLHCLTATLNVSAMGTVSDHDTIEQETVQGVLNGSGG
jgi:hypothetical protein